jgi:hypothetical protein
VERVVSPEPESYDALETGITASCPICGVDIPLPHTDTPDENGLSVVLDRGIADEHIDMHTRCTCRWEMRGFNATTNAPVVRRVTNLGCPVHGEPA